MKKVHCAPKDHANDLKRSSVESSEVPSLQIITDFRKLLELEIHSLSISLDMNVNLHKLYVEVTFSIIEMMRLQLLRNSAIYVNLYQNQSIMRERNINTMS